MRSVSIRLLLLVVLQFHVSARFARIRGRPSLITETSRQWSSEGSNDTQFQLATASAAVANGVLVGMGIVADAQADMETGSDLGIDLGLVASHGDNGGPATLAEYCEGKDSEQKMEKGTRVLANWEGYGTMYPGRIADKHSNGTFDIKYDDGFDEKRVDADKVEIKIHNLLPTESIILGILQFCLFFVCYGVARMICQPWMWELHFWPVLCLTIVAVVSAILFVLLVAPTIPHFVAALAMPPYVDEMNWIQIEKVAEEVASKGKA